MLVQYERAMRHEAQRLKEMKASLLDFDGSASYSLKKSLLRLNWDKNSDGDPPGGWYGVDGAENF